MAIRAPRALPYSTSLRGVHEDATPRTLPYSASSRTAQEEEKAALREQFLRDAARDQRECAQDTRSPSTSTISSASRSWQEERQNPVCKQPSLPVPASPADSGPLPSCTRPTRIPKAQVFVARPATPRALVASSSARRPPRPAARMDGAQRGLGARCVSDYVVCAPGGGGGAPRAGRVAEMVHELELAEDKLRRTSSARASTPAPDFWKKTAGMSFEMLHDESLLRDMHDTVGLQHPLEKMRPDSPVEVSAFDFDSGSDLSMHSEPPSASNAAVFGDDVRNGFLNSLRNLNFRRIRQQQHDPWNVPDARAPTPRILDLFTGGGNPYAARASQKGFDARPRGAAPRVFSFDPYRARHGPPAAAQPFRRGKRGGFGQDGPAAGREDNVARRLDAMDRMSMHGDEYVGFMGVVPSRRELVKVKSRKWWGKLLGRREMVFD